MDGTGDHVKQSKAGSEGHRSHVPSHMWCLELKDKCVHMEKENMFVTVGAF
jgi:hypothetical protein